MRISEIANSEKRHKRMTTHHNNKRLSMPANGKRRPYKPRPWSHQDDLIDMIGKTVTLLVVERGWISGKLIAADQFTLKIDAGEKSAVTYFKSALLCFYLEE